ncbi:hypothetical protein LZM47_29355 [Pseudomonas aeruginosa]|nr:hypothetical protein [Pseudomonas aeruginosa]
MSKELNKALAEQAEAERPPQPERYTADVFHPERPYYMAQTSVVRASDFDEFATQYERIVGALRAQIEEWQEAAGRGRSDVVAYIAERAKLLEGRDAALARVAELEMQEPVALANRGLHAFWVKWTEAGAGLYGPGIKLYAAPVAQAQQLHDLDKQCRDDVARALGPGARFRMVLPAGLDQVMREGGRGYRPGSAQRAGGVHRATV